MVHMFYLSKPDLVNCPYHQRWMESHRKSKISIVVWTIWTSLPARRDIDMDIHTWCPKVIKNPARGECCGGGGFSNTDFGVRPQFDRHSLRRRGLVLNGHVFCEDLARRRNYRARACVERTPRTDSQTHDYLWQDCTVWHDCRLSLNIFSFVTRNNKKCQRSI